MEEKSFDPKTAAYLRQADATFRNGFKSDDLKKVFLDNVFEEIVGYEVKLTLMKSTSFVLEQFISEASDENLLQLLKVYTKSFKIIAENQQGCHVLQTLLKQFVYIFNTTSNDLHEAPVWKELFKALRTCSKFLLDETELVDWMCHTHSTHIYRSVLEALTGISFALKTHVGPKHFSAKYNKDIVIAKDTMPSNFLKVFRKAVLAFSKLERVKTVEILSHQNGAPCVCCMMKIAKLRSNKSLRILCEKIFSSCAGRTENDWSTLLILTKDKTASRVIESVIESDHKVSCHKLHQVLCSSSLLLVELACHPIANFVVQRLIVAPALAEQFETTLDILLNGLEDIFVEQRFGVVHKLAEQCLVYEQHQKKFMRKLMEVFHCSEMDKQKYIVSLIVSFTTFDAFFAGGDPSLPLKVLPLKTVVYHGSTLLQTLLRFNNPVKIVDSFLQIPPSHSVKMACSAAGSHAIDSFFLTEKIKQKKKALYLEHLKDVLCNIACDKYGSRVIDNIWKNVNLDMKTTIAKNLANFEQDLTKDQFGKFIFKNFGLKQFLQRPDDWKQFQVRQEKKRKMFAEFLPIDSGDVKRIKTAGC